MLRSRVIAGILGVVTITGSVAAFAINSSRITEVQVAEVTREDLSVVVSASGKAEASTRVDVYPPTAGTLASLEVTEGARVVAGQVIAALDTGPLEVQVAQADAAYAGARAQREAVTAQTPGASDRHAAQAVVDAAYSAYQLADARYQAAKAGAGAPSASDIANAQAAVVLAQTNYEAAKAAYDSFYTTVYLPAPTPRPAELETTLAVLAFARDQAAANLLTAQQGLAALMAASDNVAAVAATKAARDQAYAAYLGAQSQRDALARASSVTEALNAANAAVDAAAAARQLARESLARAAIVAPVDGVVIFNSAGASLGGASALAGLGASASSSASTELGVGSSVSPAAAPFSIVSLDTVAFEALVDETDIVRVQPGMKAVVSLDGLPAEAFLAEVTAVGIEAVTTPTGGTAFPVTLAFNAKTLPVLIGMNGSVEISIETIGDVVTIPVEALFEEEGVSYVYTVRDGRARRVAIDVGRFTDTRIEVRAGVDVGDRVVVSGVSGLEDGTRVQGR